MCAWVCIQRIFVYTVYVHERLCIQMIILNDTKSIIPGEKEYRDGLSYWNRCQYSSALPYLLRAATLQYPSAYVKLYLAYHNGHSVSADLVRAQSYREKVQQHIGWILRQANTGDPDAQTNMGECYYDNSMGVPHDYKKAAEWFLLAANQGNASGQLSLGVCYYYGRGVNKNLKECSRLYHLSANQGHAGAQFDLAYCYEYGYGVNKSIKGAIRLYRLAAAQGHAPAQNNLAYFYRHGTGVVKDLKEAIRLYRLAAAQGLSEAQKALRTLTDA